MSCSICTAIDPRVVANTGREEWLPSTTHPLTRLDLERDIDLWECPECGAFYLWEDDSSFTGSGNNDCELLTRLTDAQSATIAAIRRSEDVAGEALFELSPEVLALVLDRRLANQFWRYIILEHPRFDYCCLQWHIFRDLLCDRVKDDPEAARLTLAEIELTPYQRPHPLDQVVEACRRVLAPPD